ncbi:MAG TPA: guanine deaminase [Limnochordales bacterium]
MHWILRARLLHTPANPFRGAGALQYVEDGAVLVQAGRIAASGPFAEVRRSHPAAPVADRRPGVLLPGFVDTHVHFPQLTIIGAMGYPLLEWLQRFTLPAETRFLDAQYARRAARDFLAALARNGTTTALVFGSHVPEAQHVFFAEAARSGLRIISGLALADQGLVPPLHTTPEQGYRDSLELARRWHGQGRIRYAVTPRFALSTSDAMLAVCRRLLDEIPGSWFQTHLNENRDEIAAVARLFPWARDYLHVYEHHGLVRPQSVFAHDVHPTDRELDALAQAHATVAHCPTSNAFLGSGLFPLRRHVERGVRVALGSDVGAGTGFGLFKEGLMAYETQMLLPDGYPLRPAHLLYLATKAGAEALGLADEVGDLTPGKAADLVLIAPRPGTTLAAVLAAAEGPDEILGALFALGGEDSVAQVWVAGETVYEREAAA